MSLSDAMHELAKVLVSMPSDLNVEVMVATKVHDDVPTGFVEGSQSIDSSSTRYERIVDADKGVATKTITLFIHD